MYFQQTFPVFVPALLSSLLYLATAAPTQPGIDIFGTAENPSALSKRQVDPWIASFYDVGCHNQASAATRIVTPEGCLAWNSSQPGLYFGVNFGQGIDSQTELQLFTDLGCGDLGGAPLFAGDRSHAPGNYVQRAPKGMYKGNAPEGICFDGVHRSWPVASDGRPFMSLKPDNGPPF